MGRRPLTVSSLAARWGHAFAGPVHTLYPAAEMIPGDGGPRSAQAPDRLFAARLAKRSIPPRHPLPVRPRPAIEIRSGAERPISGHCDENALTLLSLSFQ